jgi:hypothetical protein
MSDVWITKDGKSLNICEMSNNHLMNCYKKFNLPIDHRISYELRKRGLLPIRDIIEDFELESKMDDEYFDWFWK